MSPFQLPCTLHPIHKAIQGWGEPMASDPQYCASPFFFKFPTHSPQRRDWSRGNITSIHDLRDIGITLYTRTDTRYAAFIVSLTYTAAILVTCFFTLLGHLLVRRYPALDRFLNVDIDLASVMTGTWGGGGGGGGGARGRNRASVGGWIASSSLPVVEEGNEIGSTEPPPPAMEQTSGRTRAASDTSSDEAEWRAQSAHYAP
ncbi:hypothetical protein BDD12DRAFT_481447 [Trichophaea hybrida]|nr:hypothetical protein BDD12DRAFT_481447 [Trichophaea hybrida]